jgi:hypothetical protein
MLLRELSHKLASPFARHHLVQIVLHTEHEFIDAACETLTERHTPRIGRSACAIGRESRSAARSSFPEAPLDTRISNTCQAHASRVTHRWRQRERQARTDRILAPTVHATVQYYSTCATTVQYMLQHAQIVSLLQYMLQYSTVLQYSTTARTDRILAQYSTTVLQYYSTVLQYCTHRSYPCAYSTAQCYSTCSHAQIVSLRQNVMLKHSRVKPHRSRRLAEFGECEHPISTAAQRHSNNQEHRRQRCQTVKRALMLSLQ